MDAQLDRAASRARARRARRARRWRARRPRRPPADADRSFSFQPLELEPRDTQPRFVEPEEAQVLSLSDARPGHAEVRVPRRPIPGARPRRDVSSGGGATPDPASGAQRRRQRGRAGLSWFGARGRGRPGSPLSRLGGGDGGSGRRGVEGSFGGRRASDLVLDGGGGGSGTRTRSGCGRLRAREKRPRTTGRPSALRVARARPPPRKLAATPPSSS